MVATIDVSRQVAEMERTLRLGEDLRRTGEVLAILERWQWDAMLDAPSRAQARDLLREFRGIVRLYRDLIRLRLNRGGQTRGLTGQHVQMIRVDDANNVIAFRRWMDGGPGDDVVVVANFDRNRRENFTIGFPASGAWKLQFNSDWTGYSDIFEGYPSSDVTAKAGEYDGLPAHASVNIGPYSVLVFSQVSG